jgi:adenylyltransferase/sulfurtransferase
MAEPIYPLELSVSEADQILKSAPGKAQILDVREPHETAICHVPGAEMIPMRQIPEHLTSLSRDQHLLVMCHHGGRSLRVTQYLRAQGFDHVSNIAGGIDAWAVEIDPSLPRY